MHRDDLLHAAPATLADELRAAVIFLTRIPSGVIGGDPAGRPDFRTAARVFPAVGAAIGAAGGGALMIGDVLGLPTLVSATFAAAVTVLITGGLHEDGLADTADSFGGSTVDQRLSIMDDSRVGAYGVLALVVTMLMKVGALTAIVERGAMAAALTLIAAEAVSRAAMVAQWRAQPAAKASGLASDTGPPSARATATALVTALAIASVTALPGVGFGPSILAGVLAAIAAYIAATVSARAIGGRTGDTLGACQQAAVVGFLVGASAAVRI